MTFHPMLPPPAVDNLAAPSYSQALPTVRYTARCDNCLQPDAPWRSVLVSRPHALQGTCTIAEAICDHDCTQHALDEVAA